MFRSLSFSNLKKRWKNQQAPKGSKKEPIRLGAKPINGLKVGSICTNGRIKNLIIQINSVPMIMICLDILFKGIQYSFWNENKKIAMEKHHRYFFMTIWSNKSYSSKFKGLLQRRMIYHRYNPRLIKKKQYKRTFPSFTLSWIKAKSYMIPKVEFNANHRSPNDNVLTILSRYFLTAGSKNDGFVN